MPRVEQERVLRESDEEPTAGHLGIAKTLVRLSRQYYWPGMLRTAAKYVRGCLSCQKYKAQQQATAGKMRATNVERPWEMVSTDLIGPLPRSAAGHTWLLVTQDRCTKWVELHPLRKATGRAVAEVPKTQICLRYGSPKIVISDNGRKFTSREFQDLLSAMHIKNRPAPSYTPQCNPVERANRVIKTMIAQNNKENQKNWDKNRAELAFAYNTSQHETTAHTPAYLNFGREAVSPGSLAREATLSQRDGHKERIKKFQDALELAKIKTPQSFQKQQRYYDLRRRDWTPAVGDRVLKKTQYLSNKVANFNAKLAEKYDGPYLVKQKLSPVIVDLQDGRKIPTKYTRQ